MTQAQGATGAEPARDETPAERSDRNWDELLQELRVAQTGIQILSGFLLTLPFQARFGTLEPAMAGVFLTAAAFGTLATLLVIAPVTLHRMLFRRHAKELLVVAADRLARAGLVCLGITVSLVVTLVFGFVLGVGAGIVAAGVSVLAYVGLWFVLPLWLMGRLRRRDGEAS